MPLAAPSPPTTESDALLRQGGHLYEDFSFRAATLVFCMLLGSVVVPIMWLAASLAAFFVTEISQFLLRERLMAGRSGWERPAFVVNAFLAATVFSCFPAIIWNSGSGAGYVMGLGMMLTAIMHCILVRSHHLGVCFASLAPLTVTIAWMIGPWILDHDAAASSGPTGRSLVAAALYCGICVAYMIHAAVDQNRKQRLMADALCRAEAAMRAKDRFLTSISHEIRTPLNGILGIAQISRDQARGDHEAELADTLLSSGEILKSMVDDILDHAKIEAGRLDLNPEPTDLRQLCGSIVQLYAANAEENSVDLVVDVSDAVPSMIHADRLRLHQIIANLVSNAVKFTSHGRVRIAASARPADDGTLLLEIAVEDTGRGLSDAEMETLFDPFTQAGSEASLAAKGTGLGLPISRSLAQLMGGDVSVASRLGEGARFALTFATRGVDSPSAAAPSPDAGVRARLDGMAVLLAEDNRTNRLILRKFLDGTGASLTEVENGALALEAIRGADFDVVLMDMRMPVMDGEEAFEAIRAEGFRVPVVALTANAMPEDRRRYLARGMDRYLSKPLSKTALLRTLGEYRPELAQAA